MDNVVETLCIEVDMAYFKLLDNRLPGDNELHITIFWRGNLEKRATWKTQT
jgi:hypothetical protein